MRALDGLGRLRCAYTAPPPSNRCLREKKAAQITATCASSRNVPDSRMDHRRGGGCRGDRLLRAAVAVAGGDRHGALYQRRPRPADQDLPCGCRPAAVLDRHRLGCVADQCAVGGHRLVRLRCLDAAQTRPAMTCAVFHRVRNCGAAPSTTTRLRRRAAGRCLGHGVDQQTGHGAVATACADQHLRVMRQSGLGLRLLA